MPRIAIDTETTGLDIHHGARPYFVTVARDDRKVFQWHWPVNPKTRRPRVSAMDVREIQAELEGASLVVGQNIRFDVHALESVGLKWRYWDKTVCTLMADHLLASSQAHDLGALAIRYVGAPIERYEETLEKFTKKARARARTHYPDWRIAREGLAEMPSVKSGGKAKSKGQEDDSAWKADAWLCWALAEEEGFEPDSAWRRALFDYGNCDSQITLLVWAEQERRLKAKGLWRIFTERMKLLSICKGMEARGVTYNGDVLDEIEDECREGSERLGRQCVDIAREYGHELSLPRTGNNKSLTTFVFDVMNLPVVRETEKGAASFDKFAVSEYLLTLDRAGASYRFVKALSDKRKRDTDVSYTQNYRRFGLPLEGAPGHFVLHPNLNPTGTAHLRFSMSNPNSANIGKQEDECETCEGEGCKLCHGRGVTRRSLREPFGPAPGREWWRFDYENIEQRIPAYYAPEPKMIELFERPDEPPYFGSFHLLNASLVYPELFWPLARQKGAFKKKYAATNYQWIKNFGFAKNYGGGRAKCDQTAHRAGAFDAVGNELRNLTRLNDEMIALANRRGYVETIPDKTVDPKHGYPIWCQRSSSGRVSPTVPLNYFVSGTAMWCTIKAMIRVDAFLQEETRKDPEGFYMALQVHDELVLDFPAYAEGNVARAMEVKRLMEMSGDDIGIPLKVSVGYHPVNWAEEQEIVLSV